MKQRINPYATPGEAIQGFLVIEKNLGAAGLGDSRLHPLKTRVSQINGCAYCLHMHTKEARDGGETEARLYLLNAWRESALYTPRERAAFAWAEALTNITDGHAPDVVYEEARSQFSEKELADLSVAIAMINSWNRLAIGARTVHPNDRVKS